jgi:CRISPR-associated protein Cas2
MSQRRMHAVFLDIIDDKRRTRLMKLLKGYGARVQYSVFECYLRPAQRRKLQSQIARLIDTQVDSVRFYQLDARAVAAITVMGVGQVSDDPPFVVVRAQQP